MRKIIQFNQDWKFIKQDENQAMNIDYDDGNWKAVQVPHTWNASDGTNGFAYHQGACWYRKEFTVDDVAQGNRVFIEFEGANSVTDVYLNGNHLGQHRGGYSTFRFDLTDTIKLDKKNILAVKVNNTVVDDVYPQMADFTFYGGIYRDVNLVIANPVHFDLMDYGSKGVYVIQEAVNDEKATLTIKSLIVNDSNEDKEVRLWVNLLDAEGKNIAYTAKEVALAAGKLKVVEVPLVIANPTLWNGRENPYMYEARVSMENFNDVIDELTIPFGVRYFEVDAEKGFFLNGEHLALHGVARHQDRKDMGWAITEKEQDEDMALIKEIGATSIRLAHYQHNQYFYDLCDQEGMVVWAEIPFISVMSKTELEGINAKQQMVELIRQNFHHPSIMFWGIQNEIQISGERPELRKLVGELNELTKKEDPTRLSTMANVMFVDDKDDYNYVTDTLGFNKYYGWYNGEAEDFAAWIDGFHQKNPTVKLAISEYGAEGILQYHSNDPKIKDYSEEYHALYHETVWKIFEKRPFLWATYAWNMFDFGANIRDEGGVKGRNNKGLVTFDRKIKKDAFYLYQAHWAEEKFVHITSKRFVDRADDKITIKVYSNCNEVNLFVNGAETATLTSDDKVFIFENISLKSGTNEIKVIASDGSSSLQDVALFNKVVEPNESYVTPEDAGGFVNNWFELPDLGEVEVQELEITDDVYSTHCTVRELFENEAAKAIIMKYLGSVEEHPMFGMAQGFKIEDLSQIVPDQFNEKVLYSINKELTQIRKSEQH